MSDQNPSVKLMIQSGLIPNNTIQQLVNWRLLPESSVELSGTRPINMEKEWDDVESFVNELKTALDEEAKTIRETDLDQVAGEYQEVVLSFRVDESGAGSQERAQVFVDKLGRIVLPPDARYQELEEVIFLDEENGGEPTNRNVVKVESRFKGQKVSSYVVYLEAVK